MHSTEDILIIYYFNFFQIAKNFNATIYESVSFDLNCYFRSTPGYE